MICPGPRGGAMICPIPRLDAPIAPEHEETHLHTARSDDVGGETDWRGTAVTCRAQSSSTAMASS
jgi:hypothetical protein